MRSATLERLAAAAFILFGLALPAAAQDAACAGPGLTYDELRGLDAAEQRAEYERVWPCALVDGAVWAQTELGRMYETGIGVPQQDYVAAHRWLGQAAAQGDPEAQTMLGRLFEAGLGAPRDYEEAFDLYWRAAIQRHPQAEVSLGDLYAFGLGVAPNLQLAVGWYLTAAHHGNAEAQNKLGNRFRDGRGVAQDYVEAIAWFRLAASQGYAAAEANLADLCSRNEIAALEACSPSYDMLPTLLTIEYLVTMNWPDGHDDDIDVYVRDPLGNIAWYHQTETGLLVLEKDDRGNFRDVVIVDGEQVANPLNEEILAIRGVIPGEYVINVHHYVANGVEPVPVTVTVDRISPDLERVFAGGTTLDHRGDERTVARITFGDDGLPTRITDQQVSLTMVVRGGGGLAPPADMPEEPAPVEEAPPALQAATPFDADNALLMELACGRVVIAMRPDLAPLHVAQIKTLARQGFYDGIIFHRVIDGFMAQSGDPTGTGMGGSDLPDIPAEFSDEPYVRGTVGMARTSDPNSGNSQFFITFDRTEWLDGQYTVWGQVIEGMDCVDLIARGEPPPDPDVILSMRVAGDPQPEPAPGDPPVIAPDESVAAAPSIGYASRTLADYAFDEELMPRQLKLVFGVSRRSDVDVVVTASGDVLSGAVLQDALTIEASYGTLNIATRYVAGMAFADGRVQVLTVDNGLVSGTLATDTLSFDMAAGPEIALDVGAVAIVALANPPGSYHQPAEGSTLLLLRNGDRLIASLPPADVPVSTPYADVRLTLTDIASMRITAAGTREVEILLRNGERLRGTLERRSLTITDELTISMDELVALIDVAAAADYRRAVTEGEEVAARCAGCHTFNEGGQNAFGPNLFGVLGRPVGSAEGFTYSSALKALNEEGAVWTIERLDAFLANPQEAVPGTVMPFGGLADADRADLITYLATLAPEPVAEASPVEDAPAEEAASPLVDFAAIIAAGDVAAGEALSGICAGCHTFNANGPNMFGPNLFGVVGSLVGGAEGFNFSPAMSERGEAGEIWTAELLDAFIENPQGTISGTMMPFGGLRDPDERADLIAYLATLTADGAGSAASTSEDGVEIGSAYWELLQIDSGPAITGAVTIPGRELLIQLGIGRSSEAGYSHDLIVLTSVDPIENVSADLRVVSFGVKASEDGVALVLSGRIASEPDFYHLALSRASEAQNMSRLRLATWFEIVLESPSGEQITVSFPKGDRGEEIFAEVIEAWGQTEAVRAPSPQLIVGFADAIESATIMIGDNRIMLYGLESVHPPQQCEIDGVPWECWVEAVRALHDLLDDGPLSCRPVAPPDAFGRELALCEQNGESFNARYVRSGYALAIEDEMFEFALAEAEAREEGIGLWQGTFVEPAEFRASRGITERRP